MLQMYFFEKKLKINDGNTKNDTKNSIENNKSFLVAAIYFDRRNNDLFPDKSRNLQKPNNRTI